MQKDRINFRPSVIIFVDNVGEHISHYLGPDSLLACLKEPLQQGVGLIQFPVSADENKEARGWFAHDAAQTVNGKLEQVVEQILARVQMDRLKLNVQASGYWVANSKAQVFIVGSADSKYMRQVLHVVHDRLHQLGIGTEVSYVLNRYPSRPRDALPTSVTDWSSREVTNFCYLYEDTFYPGANKVDERESYYATAQAIFSLIATDITTQQVFENQIRNVTNLNGHPQIGSINTSLVIFPRAAIQQYCSAQLGTELMDQWIEAMNKRGTTGQERIHRQQQAQAAANELQQGIEDRETRPGTESLWNQQGLLSWRQRKSRAEARVSKWPTLNLVLRRDISLFEQNRQELQTTYNRLENESRRLFGHFSFKSIQEEHKHHRHTAQTWAEIAYRRSGTAASTYLNWDGLAASAWGVAGLRVNDAVKHIIDQLWPSVDNGLELARVYIDEYDDKLTDLASMLSVWRKAHEDKYQAALSEFEHLGTGEWLRPEDQTRIRGANVNQGAGMAAPSLADINVSPGGGSAAANANQPQGNPAGGILGQALAISLHQHLPEREDRIADHLGQRITWEQSRVPSGLSLVAAGVLAAPALVLLALTFFPVLAAHLLLLLLTCVVITTAMGVGSWAFHWVHSRKVVKIQRDLLRFYGCYYAHRCEQREDQLRVRLMGPLRRRVQAMRERLDNINAFINDVRNSLHTATTLAQDDLFNSPAASRDVLVANGAPLQRTIPGARNTLADFATAIRARRQDDRCKQPWHHPNQLKDSLLRSFQGHSISLVEMSVEGTHHYICDFTRSVIDAYLEGELVDVGVALDMQETWDEAYDRARAPLSRSREGMMNPELIFVCGCRADIARGQEHIRDAQRVFTDNADWLLYTTFWRDRSSGVLDVDVLFPPKPSVGSKADADSSA